MTGDPPDDQDLGRGPADAAVQRRRGARRWRRRLLVVAACPLAAILVAELALRLLGPETRPPNPPGLFVADDRCGFRLARSFAGELLGQGEPLPIRTNSLGFRDDELPPPADGVRRLLVLGDSQCYGHGVRAEEAFPRVLQVLLEGAGRPALVINAGVPGHGTWNELGLLEASVDEVRPDEVLLTLYVGNDFRDNLPEHFGRITACSGVLVSVMPGQSELLVALEAAVAVHSRLAPVIYARLGGAEQVAGSAVAARRRAFCDDLAWGPGFGFEMLRARWEPVAQRAFDSTCRALEAVRRACASRGLPLRLALLPGPCQYSDPYWEAIVASCGLAGEDYDRARPNRALMEWATTHGIPALDLLPAFVAAQREQPGLPLSTDVHFSVAGHRRAAQALADFLLD